MPAIRRTRSASSVTNGRSSSSTGGIPAALTQGADQVDGVGTRVLSDLPGMLRLVAFCRCCRSSNVELVPTRVPGGLPSQPPVCGTCARHMGTSPRDIQKREADHFAQWERDRERAVENQRSQSVSEIERLSDQVRQLEQQLADRPVRIVEQNLDQQAVNKASDERDQAYRSRDSAYALLAALRSLHHDTGGGICTCNRPIASCRETELLDGSSAYRRWELSQHERLRRGQWSQLPADHPARINSRWLQPLVE